MLKKILYLAIPSIIYNVTDSLIGLVDMAMLSRIDDAFYVHAGVGLSVGVLSSLMWGLAQVRTVISAQVSKFFGQNQLSFVKTLVPQSLVLSLCLGVFFGVVTYLLYPFICQYVFDASHQKVVSYSTTYFGIRAYGLGFSLVLMTIFGVFRGMQNTSYAMWISLLGGVVNIVLDKLLIFGAFGFIPAMGVRGAAYASVVAQIVMCIVALFVLVRKTPFRMVFNRKINPMMPETLMMIWNMLVRTVVLNCTFMLALRVANQYGTDVLNAYNYGMNIWLFSSFFLDGFSNVGNAMSGKLKGEKDPKQFKRITRYLLKINVVVALLLSSVYLLFYGEMVLFFTDNQAVISLFNGCFWIVVAMQPLNSITYTLDGIFKGLGEAKKLRNILLSGSIFVFVPVLLLAHYVLEWRLYGVWLAFVCWMLWRSGQLYVNYRRYRIV